MKIIECRTELSHIERLKGLNFWCVDYKLNFWCVEYNDYIYNSITGYDVITDVLDVAFDVGCEEVVLGLLTKKTRRTTYRDFELTDTISNNAIILDQDKLVFVNSNDWYQQASNNLRKERNILFGMSRSNFELPNTVFVRSKKQAEDILERLEQKLLMMVLKYAPLRNPGWVMS